MTFKGLAGCQGNSTAPLPPLSHLQSVTLQASGCVPVEKITQSVSIGCKALFQAKTQAKLVTKFTLSS